MILKSFSAGESKRVSHSELCIFTDIYVSLQALSHYSIPLINANQGTYFFLKLSSLSKDESFAAAGIASNPVL